MEILKAGGNGVAGGSNLAGGLTCKTKTVHCLDRSSRTILEKQTESWIPVALANLFLLDGRARLPDRQGISQSEIMSLVEDELAKNLSKIPLDKLMEHLKGLELTGDGRLIRFCASLLKFSGIPVCLQEEEAKEAELCVYLGNNQFCTLIKHNSELYRLATDEAYEYQPQLVWENLKQVNGLRVFKSGDFHDFTDACMQRTTMETSTDLLMGEIDRIFYNYSVQKIDDTNYELTDLKNELGVVLKHWRLSVSKAICQGDGVDAAVLEPMMQEQLMQKLTDLLQEYAKVLSSDFQVYVKNEIKQVFIQLLRE